MHECRSRLGMAVWGLVIIRASTDQDISLLRLILLFNFVLLKTLDVSTSCYSHKPGY
jgi:hypothetical protein